MVGVSVKKHVRAPVERVFAAAADLRGAPRWIPAIKKIEVLTEGAVRQGTRFRETRVMFGREHTEEMEVTAFDPPRSYTLGAESCGSRFSTRLDFRSKDGGTEVEMAFEATPLTFFARVMGVMMRPMIRKMARECAKDLDALATAVEGRAPVGA